MSAWPKVTGIYDRFTLLGEPIYGPMFRGRLYDEFMSDHYMALLSGMIRLQPLVIYCLPPLQAVRDEFRRTKSEQPKWLQDASAGQRDGVYALYYAQMMWLEVMMRDRVMVWDWTHANSSRQFDTIVNRARLVIATYGRS